MQFAAALGRRSPIHAVVSAGARLADPVGQARHLLAGCLAEGDLLLGLPLERQPGGYARTFLFGDRGISVWAMAWDAGAATAVHDHHCACCFGILAGELVERRFAAVGGGAAARTSEAVRRAGFTACLVPAGPNIHQMLNLSGTEAVSVHVYGFDRRLRENSVEREYRPILSH